MSIITKQYNISIEAGADFIHPFLARDDSDNLIDLTGAVISAHLREYAEASDYIMFTATHNGAGGKFILSMPHEDTASIPYSSGVYDVFITFPDTTVEKYLEGEVTVIPAVTKPINGEIMYLLSFGSENDFPSYGMVRRLYLSHASGKMYRWNGTGYVGITQDGEDATIEIGQVETLSPDEDAYVENVGSEANAILNFGIPRGHDGTDGSDGQDGTDGQDGFSPLVSISKEGKETTISVVDIQGLQSATILDGNDGQDGADGQDGQDGADGFSPTVSISKSDGVTTVTITDADGVHTATINDGEDGTDGQDGQDGVSPTVSISKVGKVTTVTITDALGDHTATINDGEDGETPTLEWGAITGTLSDQTDLANALDNKAPVILNSASGSIASFSDGSLAPVTALSVGIEPVQDLHGYDTPWPAGGGKNLLPKGANSTSSGVTFTVQDDGSVKTSGTSTGTAFWGVKFTISAGTYTFSGCPSNSLSITCDIRNTVGGTGLGYGSDSGSGKTFTVDSAITAYLNIRIPSGVDTNNLVFYPQIESGSSKTTFAPYSNICPISGHSSAVVTRTGNYYTKPTAFYDDGISANLLQQYLITGIPNGTYKVITNIKKTGNVANCFGGGPEQYGYQNMNTANNGATPETPRSVTVTSNSMTVAVRRSTASGGEIVTREQLASGEKWVIVSNENDMTSVTIDLDGTRYGGVLNVLTGELTVDRAIVDLGDANWQETSGNVPYFSANIIASSVTKPSTNGSLVPLVCSALASATAYQIYTGSVTAGVGVETTGNVRANDGVSATKEAFKTAMTGVKLVYPLATPLTVQLTANQMQTLKGQNAIWSSAGDTSVEYRADTKLFIEGQIEARVSATKKMIAGEEIAMKASRSYTTGEYLWVGDDFYKVTSNIGNGNNITVGTNVQKCTVGEQLKLALS